MIKKVTVLLPVLLICFYSCGKKESTVTPEPTYEYDPNSEQYSYDADTLPKYENTIVKNSETTIDEQFEVYHYIYIQKAMLLKQKQTYFLWMEKMMNYK